MPLLTSTRLGLFAWSWRGPLLAAGAACLMVPLLIAGMVVQARQERTGVLLLSVKGSTITQPYGCTTPEIEPRSAECAGHHFLTGLDLTGPLATPIHPAPPVPDPLRRARSGAGRYILYPPHYHR